MMMILVSLYIISYLTSFSNGHINNMNGDYVISNPDESQGIEWSDDMSLDGKSEYFDVFSGPITSEYSQVWWTSMPDYPIPAEIVSRFKGKTIAITGYEADQVIVNADGSTGPSIPINHAYNHHYVSWLQGAGSELVNLDVNDPVGRVDPYGANHGAPQVRTAINSDSYG